MNEQVPTGQDAQSLRVIGRIMAPKDVHVLIPRTYECHLKWQKGLGRCDYIEDFMMGTLSWIIWLGPMY